MQANEVPKAKKDAPRQCRWCGAEFKPAWKGQGFCSNDCYAFFNGYARDPDRPHADDDTDTL